MLELDYPPMFGLNIRDVLGAVVGQMNNFLPSIREFRLPCAVPLAFVLPPPVTYVHSPMSPVPNSEVPALCNHRMIASRTLTQETALSFLALSIDESKFHVCKPTDCSAVANW